MNALAYYWDKFGIFAVTAVALILSSTILSPANAEGRPVKEVLASVVGSGGRIITHIEGQPVEIFVVAPAKQRPDVVMDGKIVLELDKSIPMDRLLMKNGIVTPVARDMNVLLDCQAFVPTTDGKALFVRVISQAVKLGNFSFQEMIIHPSGTVTIWRTGSRETIEGKYLKF